MRINRVTKYTCEICGATYSTPEKAELCETRKLSGNKDVKVGDVVLVTGGEGSGHQAKVTNIGVCDKEYGHYAWERYWHTVYVTADLIDHWGSRILLFDQYETVSAG